MENEFKEVFHLKNMIFHFVEANHRENFSNKTAEKKLEEEMKTREK